MRKGDVYSSPSKELSFLPKLDRNEKKKTFSRSRNKFEGFLRFNDRNGIVCDEKFPSVLFEKRAATICSLFRALNRKSVWNRFLLLFEKENSRFVLFLLIYRRERQLTVSIKDKLSKASHWEEKDFFLLKTIVETKKNIENKKRIEKSNQDSSLL